MTSDCKAAMLRYILFERHFKKVTCVFKEFAPQIILEVCIMFAFNIRNSHSCCASIVYCVCYGIKECGSVVAPCGVISILFLKNRHVVSKAAAEDTYAKALMPCFPYKGNRLKISSSLFKA